MTHLKLKHRPGFTLVELVTVVFVITTLLVLLAPAIHQAQQDARRDACKNNLKQVGLAMHNYHDTHLCFPPGWTGHHPTAGEEGRYGWGMFLTPFLDQASVYSQVNFKDQQPYKAKVTQTALPVFRCPADTTEVLNSFRGGFGTSNYSANFGSVAPPRWLDAGLSSNWPGQPPTPQKTDGICWWNSNCKLRNITDGSSNTLHVGERSVASAAGIWMGVRGNNYESDQVTDCSPGHEINSGVASFSSAHTGGALFLICDGSVHFISETIDSGIRDDGRPGTFQRLGSRHDSQIVGDF
jgi:type II secretory pathway pseudopilin PulG